jgi:hypothetical protein
MGDAGLAERVASSADLATGQEIRLIVSARAGDASSSDRYTQLAASRPSSNGRAWFAWWLAVERCDRVEAQRWAEVIRLLGEGAPSIPIELGSVPTVSSPLRPNRYPAVVWGFMDPARVYVAGTWTYRSGVPDCST